MNADEVEDLGLLDEPEVTVVVGELLADDHVIAFANGGAAQKGKKA